MTTMRTKELRPHSENEKLYGSTVVDAEFVDSVARLGILTPLLVTHDKRIISGHRRWMAAQKIGLAEVPVSVFPSDNELDIQEAIVESNRQRQKTNEQMGREAKLLFEVERERANNRQAEAARQTHAKLGRGNMLVIQEPQASTDNGKARDKVGKLLGYGGRHVEKAAQLVTAIDDLEASGKKHDAEVLRVTLNNSVNKAYDTARERGYIAPESRTTVKAEPKLPDFITLDQWQTLDDAGRFAALSANGSSLKMNKQETDNIEWALWSWNPVTGCLHNCDYCYARDIANRFYPQGFAPSIVPARLSAPANTAVPAEAAHNIGYKNVFTCSMADLFGKWVPSEWIEAVLDVVRNAPQWNFLFLTKFPIRMAEFDFPPNAWVGTSVDRQYAVDRAEKAFRKITAGIKFLSCEPMLERLTFTSLDMFDWVIMGGSSKSTQTQEFRPPREWVNHLQAQARDAGCKIYEKTNLLERIREYPGSA